MDDLLGALTIANSVALVWLFRTLKLRPPTANPQPVMDERTGQVQMIPQELVSAVQSRVVDMEEPHIRNMG